jgi:hypothetical protein
LRITRTSQDFPTDSDEPNACGARSPPSGGLALVRDLSIYGWLGQPLFSESAGSDLRFRLPKVKRIGLDAHGSWLSELIRYTWKDAHQA